MKRWLCVKIVTTSPGLPYTYSPLRTTDQVCCRGLGGAGGRCPGGGGSRRREQGSAPYRRDRPIKEQGTASYRRDRPIKEQGFTSYQHHLLLEPGLDPGTTHRIEELHKELTESSRPVVWRWLKCGPKCTMLKYRDYRSKPYIIAHIYPKCTRGVGEGLWGVVWIWVIVGEECEVGHWGGGHHRHLLIDLFIDLVIYWLVT